MEIKFYSVFLFRLLLVFIVPGMLFSGCSTPDAPAQIQQEDVMLFLDSGLRPETIYFPEYLLLPNIELNAHGYISGTPLIGAGLTTDLALKVVWRQYKDLLFSKGWKIEKMEVTNQSFWFMVTQGDEVLEIRGVQGTGPTQLFILYRPLMEERRVQP